MIDPISFVLGIGITLVLLVVIAAIDSIVQRMKRDDEPRETPNLYWELLDTDQPIY